jgi:hypothetical protein
MTDEDEARARAREALEIANKIKPMLHGKGPQIQGSVLAELVSIYFAGHHPKIREGCLEVWLETMREMIEVNELFPKETTKVQ